MAFTHYKARGAGKLPLCAICGGPGEGRRERVELTHGVDVWLCATHRAPAFMVRRAGRDFAASLGAVWSAAGCLTRRRGRALEAHLRRVRGSAPRPRPGSYAWPDLRRELEDRLARGEPARAVMGELRARDPGRWARGPSLRTLRRWRQEARWLRRSRPVGGPPKSPPPPAAPVPAPLPARSASTRPARSLAQRSGPPPRGPTSGGRLT